MPSSRTQNRLSPNSSSRQASFGIKLSKVALASLEPGQNFLSSVPWPKTTAFFDAIIGPTCASGEGISIGFKGFAISASFFNALPDGAVALKRALGDEP